MSGEISKTILCYKKHKKILSKLLHETKLHGILTILVIALQFGLFILTELHRIELSLERTERSPKV